MLTDEEKRAVEEKVSAEYEAKEHEDELKEYEAELRKKKDAEFFNVDAVPMARNQGRFVFVIMSLFAIARFDGTIPNCWSVTCTMIAVASLILAVTFGYCGKAKVEGEDRNHRKRAGFVVLRHVLYGLLVWWATFALLHNEVTYDYVERIVWWLCGLSAELAVMFIVMAVCGDTTRYHERTKNEDLRSNE